MIDKYGTGFIMLTDWLQRSKKAGENYGVKLNDEELKEIFSEIACDISIRTSDPKISKDQFQTIFDDEYDSPCAKNWKWAKIAAKVTVVLIEICCLSDVCDC